LLARLTVIARLVVLGHLLSAVLVERASVQK
jgi:hypothetical protein